MLLHSHIVKASRISFQIIPFHGISKFAHITEDFVSSIPSTTLFSDKIVEKKNIEHHVSVGTINNQTMPIDSLNVLARWQERKRFELGCNGYIEYIKNINLTAFKTQFAIAEYLQSDTKTLPKVDMNVQKFIDSASPVLKEITKATSIHKLVSHPLLAYRAKIGAVIDIDEKSWIVEWKTIHERRKVTTLSDTYDAALQIAASIAAYNLKLSKDQQVSRGLLVYLYPTGEAADFIPVTGNDLESCWQMWLSRLAQYYSAVCKDNRDIQRKIMEADTLLKQSVSNKKTTVKNEVFFSKTTNTSAKLKRSDNSRYDN